MKKGRGSNARGAWTWINGRAEAGKAGQAYLVPCAARLDAIDTYLSYYPAAHDSPASQSGGGMTTSWAIPTVNHWHLLPHLAIGQALVKPISTEAIMPTAPQLEQWANRKHDVSRIWISDGRKQAASLRPFPSEML